MLEQDRLGRIKEASIARAFSENDFIPQDSVVVLYASQYKHSVLVLITN